MRLALTLNYIHSLYKDNQNSVDDEVSIQLMIQLMDVPDSEEEGVTGCTPWMDSYPVNNGLVFGGVGTSGGYALDDGSSEGLSLSSTSVHLPP